MIRIDRGPEPSELPRVRRCRLARAVLARRGGDEAVLEGYSLPEVRTRLYERQHAKCAYCDWGFSGNPAGLPVEHFRPKRGVDRADPFTEGHSVDKDRYWWLTWSWNNLFLACVTCNSAGFKGNRFPMEPGSEEVQVPDGLLLDDHACFRVEDERPLLLDPAWDDPLDHIEWRPLDPAHPDGQWTAVPKTERGRVTVKIFGWDIRNVDRVGWHIRHNVMPWANRVTGALARGDVDTAGATWREAIAHLFAPMQPFHAATHDALAHLLPLAVRQRAGLDLPRPGASSPIGTGVETTRPVTLPAVQLGLPEEVILQLLAEERRTPDLITLICQARPSTVDELAALLELSIQTVRRHCAEIASRGELALNASGRYSVAASSSKEAQ